MTNAISELKARAEILHKQIKAQDPQALRRLRLLKEFRRCPDDRLHAAEVYGTFGLIFPQRELASIKRHDCLNIIAQELGFPHWRDLKIAITGESEATEFGTLLHRGGGHLNRWYVRYDEAARDKENCAGYLLAYKRDLLVVDRYFIESLGLDPDDQDWVAIGYDWVRPANRSARTRLYDKLIATLPREHYRSAIGRKRPPAL